MSDQLSHPCQQGIGQSQDALPVDPGEEEAVRRLDGGDIDDEGPIWPAGDGDAVDAQLTLPVALGVPNRHHLAGRLVRTGAKDGRRGGDV